MAEPIVYVYETQLDKLFRAGGGPYTAHGYATRKTRQATLMAIADAPIRTGTLKRSHRAVGVLYTGPFHCRGTIINTAEHALWVHNGTDDYVDGDPRSVPRKRGNLRGADLYIENVNTKDTSPRRSVRGQRAQPWLEEALNKTMRRP